MVQNTLLIITKTMNITEHLSKAGWKRFKNLLKTLIWKLVWKLFHDGGPYHTETSLLTSSANQWIGLHMIATSVMKESKQYEILDVTKNEYKL